MRRDLILGLAVAAVSASPALASTFTASRADPLVCKRDRQTNLGSHFRAPRTCMLRSQWREMEEHTQRELQQILDGQNASNGATGGGPAPLNRNPL